jgi:hypothetical protein
MACEGECFIVDEVGESVEWDWRAEELPKSEVSALSTRAKDEKTKSTKYGCPGCWCKPTGKPHTRVTHEFVVYKVVLPGGKEAYMTGWVTVSVRTWDGECKEY